MLEPKEIELTTSAGEVRKYTLHKFPAIAGREIVAKYPLANMPKLGDYQVSEEVMLKLIAFVTVTPETGAELELKTRSLVDNHVPDWETLARLEWAMLEYNCSFFRERRELRFLRNYQSEAPAVDFPNFDGFIGAILASRQASILDLKYRLTLEDAFDIWEVEMTTKYNEYLAIRHANKAR